VDKKAEGNY